MTPANLAGQFGDTTYTKVFVGGLAWETQKETMKKYFEQFGEILEAVVITDKATGRSKGYGFVTFREAEAAMRACVDASPVIDGRRANCNLASLGVQRSKPSTPKNGGTGRNFRVMGSFQTGFGGGVGTAFPSAATFPHYAIQQGIPYNLYGATITCMEGHLPNSQCMERDLAGWSPVRRLRQGVSTNISSLGKGVALELRPPATLLDHRVMVSTIHITCFHIRPSTQLGVTHSTMVHPCLLHLRPPCHQCVLLCPRRDHGSSCTNSSSLEIHLNLATSNFSAAS
ncbi:hypothetical protein I3843_03G011300 [Carya illinoinensis]|uniref:RRM domain-containing protein n=1 Tax=Carya illinoinensis TaxID=32201 RepID=A0A922FB84_CARIL|nr:hypothetical protein I3842_03G006900 [Carya illinoinensis]KAG7985165.1 hypothetical protein I3843_03G011300 [Carya illinoinensis]